MHSFSKHASTLSCWRCGAACWPRLGGGEPGGVDVITAHWSFQSFKYRVFQILVSFKYRPGREAVQENGYGIRGPRKKMCCKSNFTICWHAVTWEHYLFTLTLSILISERETRLPVLGGVCEDLTSMPIICMILIIRIHAWLSLLFFLNSCLWVEFPRRIGENENLSQTLR